MALNAATRRIVDELRAAAEPGRKTGMARVGIRVDHALGVSIPQCRRIARGHRGNHELALDLWASGIHEARIVASMIDDPANATLSQMERWVADFDSWDVCDQVCSNLFGPSTHVYPAARVWSRRDEEFVRRAGFTLIAERAVRDRVHDDAFWLGWLPVIHDGATDDRNYVKKAVNWALRQIGKRDVVLNASAIAEAEHLLKLGSPSARWIARDALRELRSDAVRARLQKRG
ncbi:MAG: DNA alkylation repair protein [Actinomycetota bacterium]